MKVLFILALACLAPMAQAAVRAVASNAIIADWLQQIGGDQVEITTLAGPGVDPHHYAPSPKDIARLTKAELIVSFGQNLEPWLVSAVQTSGTKARVLDLTQGLDLMAPGQPYWQTRQPLYPNAESRPPCCREDAVAANAAWAALSARMPALPHVHHSHGRDHHHHHHGSEKDPHVWLDPQMVLIMVLEMNSALSDLAPALANNFDQRREDYLNELIALDEWAQTKIDHIPVNRRLLVTYHDNLRYFGRHYGLLTPASILGSVTTETADPSAKQFQQLVDLIREFNIPAIFVDATANPRLAEQIAREADLPAPVVLHTGNLTSPGGPAPNYLSLMRYNVSAISNALE